MAKRENAQKAMLTKIPEFSELASVVNTSVSDYINAGKDDAEKASRYLAVRALLTPVAQMLTTLLNKTT